MKRHAKAPSAGPSMRQAGGLRRIIRGALAMLGGSQGASGSGAPSARLVLVGSIAVLAAIALGASAANAIAPVITAPTASNVEYTTAHLEGEVNPEDKETSYHFEYITDAQYLANEANAEPLFSGASHTPSGSLPEGAGLTPVSADRGGLSPQTVYHLRLVAENESGTESAVSASTFETKGPVVKPTIENLTISNVTTDSAHFSAEINPNGSDPAFETNWHFECEPSCGSGASHSGPALSGGAQVVETDATGLDPDGVYTVRLYADNSAGLAKATDAFKTAGSEPLVKPFEAGPVLESDAYINAEVDPRGSDTVYWFEWGKEDCSAPEADCQSVPAEHDASAGSGPLFKYVSRHLTGLSPESTYHFRVVAKNDFGTVEGAMREFTTPAAPSHTCSNDALREEQHATYLPDCRAYEMVSPPEKNGADVIRNTFKVVASDEGGAVTYGATGAYGDTRGTSSDVQYLARRGAVGWNNHAISPPTSSLPLFTFSANVPTFEHLNSDLTAGIYRAWYPLTDAPEVEGTSNLYRLRDLDAASFDVELLSPSVSPLGSPPYPPPFDRLFKNLYSNAFDAASEDLGHVIFQSVYDLTGDGSFDPSGSGDLFEFADGVGVRRVGRIPMAPDTTCDEADGPPCVDAKATAGISADFVAGGSQHSGRMISADGSRILFSASGGLYLREDGVRTYQVNASEKSEPESPGNAVAWEMTPDGSRIFFTTSEGLVEGDESGVDLYMYDRTAPEGSRLTRLSVNAAGNSCEAQGVIGASNDGHAVYFLCAGQLVPGAPNPESGIFLWHDGDISYLGGIAPSIDQYNTQRTAYEFPYAAKWSRVSPDGRFLLFMAAGDDGLNGIGGFAGYEHESVRQLYVYSAETGRLVCASCNPRAPTATEDVVTDIKVQASATLIMDHLSQSFSDDGRYVFFSTREALLTEDTNGQFDAYEFDSLTGELHLLSSGTDSSDSYFMDASPDGRDVFFATRERLVGWDSDTSYDLYDARAGGGFAEPVPVPAPCEGESCMPSAGAVPSAPPAASSQVFGSGDHRLKCRKGSLRVRRHGKVRCVKRHKRAANNNRRAGR